MTKLGKQHWLMAFLVAVLIHAGAVAAMVWQTPTSGAHSAGLGGMDISLAAISGGSAGAVAAPEIQEAETLDAAEADAAYEPQTVIPPDITETEAVDAIPETEAMPETEAIREVEAVQSTPVVPDEIQEVETVETTAVEAETVPLAVSQPPKRKPAPPPPQEVAQAKPVPAPAVTPPAASTRQPQQRAVIRPPSSPGTGGRSGSSTQAKTGPDATDATGGGRPGPNLGYLAALQAWLEKHKEYPARARARRQQGTVLLYFEMSRDGKVSAASIREGSGHSALDKEAIALLERAAPLPPPPPDFGGERIKMVIPVQFSLR